MFWGLELLPWHGHMFHIQLEAGRGISVETCGLDDVFHLDHLGPGPYIQFIIIYI